MEVRGRVALVTGASSGIGRAVALGLADAGADVLAHGRDAERTTEVARRTGGRALVADLAGPDGPAGLAASALAERGGVDVLVASAGYGWSGSFAAMPEAVLEDLITVDLLAPLRLVRALLPSMLSRGGGRIVLIGSVAGYTGVAGEAAYAAAKAGLDAFAESLRPELSGSGVGVSVVVPAAVRTPFFERRGRGYDRRIPRPVSPDRVADATLRAIRRDAAEVWTPRWLRLAPTLRALAPGPYRRLAVRFGEPVRARG